MKKSLLALAVAGAFSGAAFAQSSVTLFGIADTGYTYVKGDGNGNIKGMSNSGLNSSRIGVRGSEDLGGGLKANFWFEGSVNTDSGSGAATNTNNQASGSSGTGFSFNRRMFVGMSGGFGEFRLGRNYTPMFMQVTSNDPFGTNGIGETTMESTQGLFLAANGSTSPAAAIATNVRASNALEYLTPSGIGGVYVHAMYALGENPSVVGANVSNPNANDGRVVSIRAGWAGGPADISVAYVKTTLAQSTALGSYTVYGLGGTLTFGAFKPMFQYYKHKVDIDNTVNQDPERTDFMLGLVATFGATDLRMAFNNNNVAHPGGAGAAAFDGARQYSIGPVYNLSRRTAIYGTIAMIDNKNQGVNWSLATTGTGSRTPLTAGGKSEGIEFGIRHSF